MLLSLRGASLAERSGLVPGMVAEADQVREDFWYRWVAASFLKGYLKTVKGTRLIPEDDEEVKILLDTMLTEAAVSQIVRDPASTEAAIAILN